MGQIQIQKTNSNSSDRRRVTGCGLKIQIQKSNSYSINSFSNRCVFKLMPFSNVPSFFLQVYELSGLEV